MADTAMNMPSIDRIKRDAKRIKKEMGITHTEALSVAASRYGFQNYMHFLRESDKAMEAAND